jgi:hypothetical protein
MNPSGIRKEVALALCDERKLVIEEIGSGDFAAVDECIKNERKNRFFERVLARIGQIDDNLRLHAGWARNLHTGVAGVHIRLDHLEVFLVTLQELLGQQQDLKHGRTKYCDKQPDAPECGQSDFYTFFLDNLPKLG